MSSVRVRVRVPGARLVTRAAVVAMLLASGSVGSPVPESTDAGPPVLPSVALVDAVPVGYPREVPAVEAGLDVASLHAALPGSVAASVTTGAGVATVVAGTPVSLTSSIPITATVTTRAQSGGAGLLVQLSAEALPGPTQVQVDVDYAAFADVVGGGYAGRLKLAAVPGCAMERPGDPSCGVPVDLPTRNDLAAQSLSTTVMLTPTAAVATLVTATNPSSQAGDFTAAGLGPSGTWSAGGSSGGFSWSYPLVTPPSAVGSGPSISLGYSSAVVDGRIASTNNQTSWIGTGWDYTPGYIERSYHSCADVLNDRTATSPGTPGLCWDGQLVSLNLGGSAMPLVRDDATGEWHPEADGDQRVELLTAGASGTDSGEYWKVTTTDGTQYWFGREARAGAPTDTRSRWTVPVRSARSGEPGYSTAGAWASTVVRPWRWNLDYVIDTHGNVTRYTYSDETNKYYADAAHPSVSYTRAGTLSRIDYGLVADAAGNPPVGLGMQQVLFDTRDRCLATPSVDCSGFDVAHQAAWADTPVDLACDGATCTQKTPTFWSKRRLVEIKTMATTQSGLVAVDTYQLGHQFQSTGDHQLNLISITRTGSAGATPVTLPQVDFQYTALPNRLDTTQYSMLFPRLTKITTETGSTVTVAYHSDCSTATKPADPATNTSMCMPVNWFPPGNTAPLLDYFNKYVTDSVTAADALARSPAQLTRYTYVGSVGWHADTDSVPGQSRTYGQYRGYAQVNTSTGIASGPDPDPISYAETYYLRGLGGTVTNVASESITDADVLSDNVYQTKTYSGPGGSLLSATTTTTAALAVTATRARPAPGAGQPPLTAQLAQRLGTPTTRSITYVAGGNSQTLTTTTTYDGRGRPVRVSSHAVGVLGDEGDTCAGTAYVENTTAWIRDKAAAVWTAAGPCPAPPAEPGSYLTRTTTQYDGLESGIGSTGDATGTRTYTTSTAYTETKATFDSYGRMVTTDLTVGATHRKTSTVYAPSTAAAPRSVAVTVDPGGAGLTTTRELDPTRASVTAVTDPLGLTAKGTYDGLGRLVEIRKPLQSTGNPTATFEYRLVRGQPLAVTTKTLVDTGTSAGYITSIALADSLGQSLQSQTSDGKGNRVVTDTSYDSHGWVKATNERWYTTGDPSTTLIETAIANIDARTITTYDGVGRALTATALQGGTVRRTSTSVYSGNAVTITPPVGGTITTSTTDARGRTTSIRQYTSAPTITGNAVTGGTYQETTYTYDAAGRLTGIRDPAAAQWVFAYDMAGRRISQTDPDTATGTSTYNEAGQPLVTTNANGTVLTSSYDTLGHQTSLKNGLIQIASWTYDTKGRPSTATRYTNGKAYTRTTSYDPYNRIQDSTLTLPDTTLLPGTLNGSYTTSLTYTSTDLPKTLTLPALADLPAETLTSYYDNTGRPIGLAGYSLIVSAATYTPYGEPTRYTLGVNNQQGWLTYTRDPNTRALTGVNLTTPSLGQVENLSYTYDEAGNTTKVQDTQGANGQTGNTQTTCYHYDALNQLTDAWAATDNCATQLLGPTAAATSIGGVHGYHTTWAYTNGMLTSRSHYDKTTNATTTDTYTNGVAGHSHALARINSGPSYTYDAAGNTLTRPTSGGTEQYTYDPTGRTNTITLPGSGGTISYTLDADGAQLIRTDPTTTTLYLGGQELTRNNATGAKTATRYYTFNSQTLMLRTGNTNPTWLLADPHNTVHTTITTTSTGPTTIQRRILDPYGRTLKTSTPTWADTHGYLNQPQTPNGLVDTGARKYDPTTARFLTPDPLLALTDPLSLPAYTYANNNPVTNADPSGLVRVEPEPDLRSEHEGPRGLPADAGTPSATNFGPVNIDMYRENTRLLLSGSQLPYIEATGGGLAAWSDERRASAQFAIDDLYDQTRRGRLQQLENANSSYCTPMSDGRCYPAWNGMADSRWACMQATGGLCDYGGSGLGGNGVAAVVLASGILAFGWGGGGGDSSPLTVGGAGGSTGANSTSAAKGTVNIIAAARTRPSFRKSTERSSIESAPRGPDGGPVCLGCGTPIGRGKVEYGGRMRRDFDLDHFNQTWAERVKQFSPDVSRAEVINTYQQDVRATCPICNQSHVLEGR